MHEAARQSLWDSWSEEKRRASALDDLQDAERLALSAQGCLEAAVGAAKLDYRGFGGTGDSRDDKQSALTLAFGELAHAHALARDAALKAGVAIHLEEVLDIDPNIFAMDTLLDSRRTDRRALDKAREAQAHGVRMLRQIVEARRALEGELVD